MNDQKPHFGLYLFAIFGLLIFSVIIALYLGATEEVQESAPIEGQVTVEEMQDYLAKMNRVIGVRDLTTKSGRLALKQTASMIDGTLGSMNLGYEVSRSANQRAEGLLWKTLWIDAGNSMSNEVVLLVIPYGESGTSLAFALGFAEYLVGMSFDKKVRLAFTPPVREIPLEERVMGEGETLLRKINLRGEGGSPFWAEISQGELADQLLRDPWKERFKVNQEDEMTIRLGERHLLSSRGHAAQLLKMFPVVVSALRD
ncbi:MAG: hypothetical protein ACN4GG_02545 [Akkermansiaceae bacterium]